MSTSTSTVTSGSPLQPVQQPVQQPAPAPAAAPTRQEQVADVINQLTLSNCDQFWIKYVENQSAPLSILGRIGYIFYSFGQFVGGPKVSDTIGEFNNAATELAKAVAARGLTKDEAAQSPIHGLKGDLSDADAVANEDRATTAEKNFYTFFKKRVTELSIDRNDLSKYGIAALAAQKIIEDRTKDIVVGLNGKKVEQIKVGSTVQNFSKKVFDDAVDGVAAKPLSAITIDYFAQKASDLNGFFPNLAPTKEGNLVAVETRMRKAILDQHKEEEFKKLDTEFTDASVNAKRFKQAKQTITREYKADKIKFEAELKKLRGEKFGDENSELHKASKALEKAKGEKEKAKSEFATAIGKVAKDVDGVDGEELVEFYQDFLANENKDDAFNVGYFTKKYSEYKEKLKAFNEAQKTWDETLEKFEKIAEYQPGSSTDLKGGKLHHINTTLRNGVDNEARKQMEKMANFYKELSHAVSEENVDNKYRSKALHRIIDVQA